MRGDIKTLFHALDLLERLMPIANGRLDAFMEFCTELEELRPPSRGTVCRTSPGDAIDLGLHLGMPIDQNREFADQPSRAKPAE